MGEYGLVPDLRAEVEIPGNGILSRTVHTDTTVTLTVFGFDAGQELSEHTSARTAIVEILEGEAEIVLAGDHHRLGPGAWIAMPPGLSHAIRAVTPMRMALTLL